ncbi:PH domain-containing protein [Nocardioides jiangxiensis]|uniref:PH domain-containing protein n=1 Tax=Nocardioides jiangxiensis TaxID=3064524 RepID=A0ABT9AYL1_9ACTN|nr:PH domain-containing protein [Nocardioides sp. WY-20]MDO7867502.1 PH domain-containing protein [Nocardioides sp. WY-20]
MSTFPARLLNDDERVVVTTRTHGKALVWPAALVVVALVLAVWSFAYDGAGNDGLGRSLLGWAMRILALVALLAAVPPFVRWWTTTYTFTNRRFIKRSGLIAKEGRTIPLNRISGVDFEIGVVDRLFGCGTLIVSDASTDGRVELDDIPRVEQVQLLVSEELHRLSQGRDHHDDGT